MSSHNSLVSPPSFAEPDTSVGFPSSDPPSLPNNSSSGTTTHGPSEVHEAENIARVLCEKVQIRGESGHGMTINALPDNVLLDIFDSFLNDINPSIHARIHVWRWLKLVHVCQMWRHIVFGSARRLDLQILCTQGTPVREILDCWPTLLIAIDYDCEFAPLLLSDEDSIFAALEHPGRVRQIDLALTGRRFDKVATRMQGPFPSLTHLTLWWGDDPDGIDTYRPSAVPNGFLRGSAPCLQYIFLNEITFPALPALLSSTSDLVHLQLWHKDGYTSPKAMLACLGVLPRLEYFDIGTSCLDYSDLSHWQPDLPPVTRTFLPALTSFAFEGDGWYLEELISPIDSPQLKRISVLYWQQEFRIPQFFNFISRSESPEITQIKHANVYFTSDSVVLEMYWRPTSRDDCVRATIVCQGGIGRQLSSMARVISRHSAFLSRVVHLNLNPPRTIHDGHAFYDEWDEDPHDDEGNEDHHDEGNEDHHGDEGNDDRHDDEWLYFLRQISTVRTLYVSPTFARAVALALEGMTGEMVTEVFPVLDLIYLDGHPVSSVSKFLTVRRLSGHPVTIIATRAEFRERIKSYVSEYEEVPYQSRRTQ